MNHHLHESAEKKSGKLATFSFIIFVENVDFFIIYSFIYLFVWEFSTENKQ